jgi:alkylation response protein AidB-like acyl-CoA dehydrogenase
MKYCFAYSEPAHGSDLDAIETRAEVVGDSWIVTGHKTWVADANNATHAVVLCRAAEAIRRVVVPLADNHVEIHPIQDLSGAHRLFDVVFDGAHAPVCTEPAFERSEPDYTAEFWDLVETARRSGRNQDALIRQQLAAAYSQLQVIGQLPDSQVRRVLAADYHRRLGEIAMDVLGADGLLRAAAEGYVPTRWEQVFLTSRGDTLAHGTTEILRTRIAEDLLGLPSDLGSPVSSVSPEGA